MVGFVLCQSPRPRLFPFLCLNAFAINCRATAYKSLDLGRGAPFTMIAAVEESTRARAHDDLERSLGKVALARIDKQFLTSRTVCRRVSQIRQCELALPHDSNDARWRECQPGFQLLASCCWPTRALLCIRGRKRWICPQDNGQ